MTLRDPPRAWLEGPPLGDGLSGDGGPGGLLERVLALTGAVWIFVLARGVSRRPGEGG